MYTEKQAAIVVELAGRIVRLMRRDGNAKQILRLKSPWDLFRIGLKVDGMPTPSHAQAYLALQLAQQKFQERRK